MDHLPGTPLFGPWNMPLISFDRLPVVQGLTNPKDCHLRQIRMDGFVRSIHTDILAQGGG